MSLSEESIPSGSRETNEVVEPGIKAELKPKKENTEAPVVRPTTTMAMFNRVEPPTFISDKKSYAAYKKDLLMWSRITRVAKTSQAEVVVYGLEGHPTGIKEKIIVNIGDQLENAEDGIQRLITFLDSIYKEDDMSAAWTKYISLPSLLAVFTLILSLHLDC